MKARKWLGPGICVMIALVLLLSSIVLPTGSSTTIVSNTRTCAEAGGQWGFAHGVGVGCFSPDGHLLAFVNN